MTDIIEERLSRDDVANGFILDGYPRNLAQARSLDEVLERLNTPADEVIQLDVNPELIIDRIAKRAKEEGRSDDSEEVVRNRMRIYHEQSAPVIDYYARKGLLTYVLADGEVDVILERILAALKVNHPSC
jgi:adenylate kinase